MRSKPRNAYLKLHLVEDFYVLKPARLWSICKYTEWSLFIDEGSRLNLKPSPRNYGLLLRTNHIGDDQGHPTTVFCEISHRTHVGEAKPPYNFL